MLIEFLQPMDRKKKTSRISKVVFEEVEKALISPEDKIQGYLVLKVEKSLGTLELAELAIVVIARDAVLATPLNVERHQVHAGEALAALLKQMVRHLRRDLGVDRLHRRHEQAAQHVVNNFRLHGDVGVVEVLSEREEAGRPLLQHGV
jgi:hypothetical protein